MVGKWRARRRFRKISRRRAKELQGVVDEVRQANLRELYSVLDQLGSHPLMPPRCKRGHGALVLRRRLRGGDERPRLFWGCRRYPSCEFTEDVTPEQAEHFERYRQ